jgi:O-succinylbenzoate synthase
MKVELEDILSTLRVIRIPMRTQFRGLEYRETAIFHGPSGWGEFASFVEYDDVEASQWLRCGIEQAFGKPSELKRDLIPINGTIPATDSKPVIEELVSLYRGAQVFKIKVGTSLSRDIERISIVRALAPKAKIRIDVNAGWSVSEAVTNLRAIYSEVTGSDLEYVEQPVGSIAELKELKEKLGIEIKIAGDEIIRKAKDPFALDLDGAIDVLMLKVGPLGGIERSLKIAAHHTIPVVVSSALESAVGISHGLRLAAALPELSFACGLATGTLFTADVAIHEIVDSAIKVKAPEPERFEDFKAPSERIEWWRDRIKRVWQVMN